MLRLKNILKTGVSALLIAALGLSAFGCSKKTDTEDTSNGVLPNQIENKRYYFQQGYDTGWYPLKVNDDGYLADEDTGLLVELVPVDENNAQIAGVEYCVYYKESSSITMTSSRNDIVQMVTDSNNALFFNNVFTINGVRDTFVQNASEATVYTAKYSKLQFTQITYTFTRDGEDWIGVYNIVMNQLKFFVITFETKAELWDTYKDSFEKTIGDFRKEGWETA